MLPYRMRPRHQKSHAQMDEYWLLATDRTPIPRPLQLSDDDLACRAEDPVSRTSIRKRCLALNLQR